MSWDPIGLDTSKSFRAYVADLRKAWPATEPTENRGEPAGNGHADLTDMTETQTDKDSAQTEELYDTCGPKMGRRTFIVATGATVALAAVPATAVADEELDFDHEAVPNPGIAATTTVAEVPGDRDGIEYADDSLPADVDDRDADDAFTLQADRIAADEYDEIEAIDPDEWTGEGDLTLDDGDLEIDAVRFDADGEGTVTFELDDEIDADGDDYLQVGVTVDELETDVEIALTDDSDNSVTALIDPDGDADDSDVIATGADAGVVAQIELDDLDGFDDVGEITEVVVTSGDGSAVIDLFGLDVGSSRWEFGEDGDGETVDEPEGEFSITEIDEGIVDGATIYDLEASVVYDAANADADTDHRLEEIDDESDYDEISSTTSELVVPDDDDLEHADLELILEQELDTDRYQAVDVADDTEDVDDDDREWSDYSDELEESGETIVLEEVVEEGTEYAVRVEVEVDSDETDDMYTSEGGGGGVTSSASNALGWILSLLAGVFGFLGLNRLIGGDDE